MDTTIIILAVAAVVIIAILLYVFRGSICRSYNDRKSGGNTSKYDSMSVEEIMKGAEDHIREVLE